MNISISKNQIWTECRFINSNDICIITKNKNKPKHISYLQYTILSYCLTQLSFNKFRDFFCSVNLYNKFGWLIEKKSCFSSALMWTCGSLGGKMNDKHNFRFTYYNQWALLEYCETKFLQQRQVMNDYCHESKTFIDTMYSL